MPPLPTIQNGGPNERQVRPQDRKSDLIVRVKYSNNLPDIPFDLKFLTYPFESERFINYMPTSLERNYKFEVLTEHDLGVNIDLINRDLYQCDRTSTLDPADEKLLEEDTHVQQDTTRSKQHAKSVSWLRRSEYISTEQTRFQPQNMEKAEAKVGYNVKNSLKEETLYMDREQQIKAIEKTFADSNTPIKNHYCKPNVLPVEVYPVYPDFKNWKFPCAQVMFDADPSVGTKSLPNQMEEMSQAMIRGVMDESGEQFVAYFLPTDETMEKRRTDFSMERTYEDETEYEYKMAREYNWNVKSKLSKGYEENYFLVIRDEGVYYNELETRVRLSKRRQKIGAQSNTKLVVKHRPLNANEHKMQVAREKQLEPTGDEEEFESEPEEEEEKKNEDEDVEMKDSERKSRSRSRSKSGSRSGSGSDRSRSRSKSGSGSDRSRSRSRSGSRSSRSRSRSRSRSKSGSGSERSRSRSKSGSGSDRSRSRSRSGSRSSAGSRRSRRSNASGSSKSRSRSRSESGSGSD